MSLAFAVLRRALVSFVKSEDVLEARDDAFLTGRATAGLDGCDLDAQGLQQFVVVQVSHCRRPLAPGLPWPERDSAQTRPHPRPSSFPRHRPS